MRGFPIASMKPDNSSPNNGGELPGTHVDCTTAIAQRTVLFPSPLPSPSGRGGILPSLLPTRTRQAVENLPKGLPLPEGEGRGEGKRREPAKLVLTKCAHLPGL